jgi:hypothetical protein
MERKVGPASADLSQRTAANILASYDFESLDKCFNALNRFILWTEDRKSSIAKCWTALLAAFDEFDQLTDNDNPFARIIKLKLCERLLTTGDLGQIFLGYLITPDGLSWYRDLPDDSSDSESETGVFTKSKIRERTDKILHAFCEFFEADPTIFFAAWDHYLTNIDIDPDTPVHTFWTKFRDEASIEGGSDSACRIADMAFILLIMPVSESEVERVFSRMRHAFGDRSRRMLKELMEARLVLQINDVHDKDELSEAFRAWTQTDVDPPKSGLLYRPKVLPFCTAETVQALLTPPPPKQRRPVRPRRGRFGARGRRVARH